MKTFKFNFSCHDGSYDLVIDGKTFCIESDIPGFVNKKGELSQDQLNAFIRGIEECRLLSWDRYYKGKGVEDACRWHIGYDDFVCEGEETFEPYDYPVFIDAISMIEEKADYFRV